MLDQPSLWPSKSYPQSGFLCDVSHGHVSQNYKKVCHSRYSFTRWRDYRPSGCHDNYLRAPSHLPSPRSPHLLIHFCHTSMRDTGPYYPIHPGLVTIPLKIQIICPNFQREDSPAKVMMEVGRESTRICERCGEMTVRALYLKCPCNRSSELVKKTVSKYLHGSMITIQTDLTNTFSSY